MRLLLATLAATLAFASSATARPNIVVFLTDDQEDTGSTEYMPQVLSLLAQNGVTFKNSFVNSPLCAPSRASFLTGQAAHNHGIRANSPVDGGGWEGFKSKEVNTLPVWLKAAGYKTALIGKYLNRYGQQSTFGAWLAWLGSLINVEFPETVVGNARDWVPPGWDLWYAFTGTRVRYYDYWINDNGEILSFDHRPSDYSTDVLKERAVRFIQDQSTTSTPFFMLVAPKAAHSQGKRAIPADKYEQALKDVHLPQRSSFNERNMDAKSMKPPLISDEAKQELELSYRASLQSMLSVDDLVAAVVDALKRADKLDDTVIIYTSDNGFLFGDHRMIGKTSAYEGSIRVPLIVRGPNIPQNEKREQLVNNLDVVATIVDLAHAAPTIALDGRSFTKLCEDANAPWRSALLIESSINRFQQPLERFTAVRSVNAKYVKYDDGFEELFDLRADPNELTNEVDNPRFEDTLTDLRRTQSALRTCGGDGCWISPPASGNNDAPH
jgi:arylsulfatase A-like enzyme